MSRHPRPANRPVRVILSLLLVCLSSLAHGASRSPQSPAPASGEPAALGYLPDEVLVRPRAADAAAVDRLLSDHGLTLIRDYPSLDIQRLRLSRGVSVASALSSLRGDARVELAQPNYLYTIATCPQDPVLVDLPSLPNQWGVFKTFLPSLWRGHNGGAGKTIAIIDTGAQLLHPDLSGGAWTNPGEIAGNSMDDDGNGFVDDVNGWNFVGADNNLADDNNHGTHVTGIACARANAAGIAGVAYGSRFMTVKVLNAQGNGVTSDIAAGILYAARMQPNVVNMSFQAANTPLEPNVDCILREACAKAMARGCVLVAASGNSGDGGPVSMPASFDGVISVGAVTASEAVAAFSNYGPDLDVVAPGDSVYSTLPGGNYGWIKGTSQAAPFVSGICALLLSRFPSMKAWEIEKFLREHARNVDGLSPGVAGNKDGYGLVSFGTLKDYSNGALPVAFSKNMFWEWLGGDVTGESGVTDTVTIGNDDGDDDLPDLDGIPNTGGVGGEDGYDDGLFPMAHANLPLLPKHLQNSQIWNLKLGVCDHAGPRYAGKTLAVRAWADSNADNVFQDPKEQFFTGSATPAMWPTDTLTLPVTLNAKEYHMRGNPLRIRTRLYGPNEAAGGPTGSQNFGEVEDQLVLNFIEDFDTTYHSNLYCTPLLSSVPCPPIADPGAWRLFLDNPGADPFCNPPGHHNSWNFAYTVGTCAPVGPLDVVLFLPEATAPPLDVRELTTCTLRLWMLHSVFSRVQLNPCFVCNPAGNDDCFLGIWVYDSLGVFQNEVHKMEIPDPDLCPNGPFIWPDQDIDLSDLVGGYLRIAIHHKFDHLYDQFAVDDVIVRGYDGEKPLTVANWSAGMTPLRQATIGWTHPRENTLLLSNPRADLYGSRLWTSADSFPSALRLTPKDFANANSSFPTIGPPGGAISRSLRAPSVFPTYTVSARAQDEVSLEGPLSTTTFSVVPSFGVLATAPVPLDTVSAGDSVRVPFVSSNTGNALDAVHCAVRDTRGWLACSKDWIHVLDPLQSAIDSVLAVVPLGTLAGTRDTLVLADTSLSNPTATDSAMAVLVLLGAPPCFHIADHDTGNVRFSITDQGICGYLTDDRLAGSGFVFPKGTGSDMLFIGSFWAATDTGHVMNRDYDTEPHPEWVPAGCIQMSDGISLAALPGNEEGLGVYTDGGHPAPKDVRVVQRSYAWSAAPDNDYVILLYDVIDEGPDSLPDLWLGQFMDWDLPVGGTATNKGASDPLRDAIYMFRAGSNEAESLHVGITSLSVHPVPQMSFIYNPTYVYPLNYIADSNRYHFLRGDAPAFVVPQTDSAGDWSMVMGAGPYAIGPGDTVRVAFAVLGGSNRNDFFQNTFAAQRTWAANWGDVRTGILAGAAGPPSRFNLAVLGPNPFRTDTALRLDLPQGDRVTLEIFDVTGRQVARLLDRALPTGRHAISWDGRNQRGEPVASGVYLARLEGSRSAVSRKVVLSR